MNISIKLSDIQIGKNYVFEFSLSEDGTVIKQNVSQKKPKKENCPSLETFEEKAPKLEEPPKLEDIKSTVQKDFKVESSFGGKINPTK